MIILIDAEKALDKNQHRLMIRITKEVSIEGTLSQHSTHYIWQTNGQHHTQQWNSEKYLKDQEQHRDANSCGLFNIALQVLAIAIRHEK